MGENTASQQKKKIPISKVIYTIILIILLLIFLFSAGSLLKYFIESKQSESAYNDLKDLMGDQTRPTAPVVAPTDSTDPSASIAETVSPYVTVTNPKTGEEMEILAKMEALYQINPDLVGWLTIPGTKVDYPVVHRPSDTDYYLHRDFYGKYSAHGCLYVREECDVFAPSDNITIYGHRMKDGSMLADLGQYTYDKDFWQEHQYLYFDTLTEFHTYQIIYVFTTTASVGEGFEYHQFVDAQDVVDFNQFVTTCARYTYYDTGLSATYGDKLITLSTCEYTHENGRLVVVAKRID